VLVNSKTIGAAEALAAVLRASDRALTVGAKTAGRASVFKEFSLSTGQKIRVATAEVKLAGGPALAGGVTPDIPVQTTLEDDRAYLSDPYKSPHPTEMSGDSQTNTQEARFNEAELVKEHREGLEAGEGLLGTSAEPGAPVIADPSLSRALDVLKGLAVVNGSKPG
jgi:C-terminal processing protease CtpA/Prc